jgi:hypothetical protein
VTALWVGIRSGRWRAGALCAVALTSLAAAQTPTNPTAATVAGFHERVKDYMALHDKAAQGLPSPTREATPADVVKHQRELEARLVPLRKGIRQGNIFTAEMQAFLRRYMGEVFSGPEGKRLKGVVMDENPVAVKYGVNSRYPDTVPMSTMPAQVLKALPKLPEGLEYRFIDRDLILLDVRAHIIVDYVTNVIPA